MLIYYMFSYASEFSCKLKVLLRSLFICPFHILPYHRCKFDVGVLRAPTPHWIVTLLSGV